MLTTLIYIAHIAYEETLFTTTKQHCWRNTNTAITTLQLVILIIAIPIHIRQHAEIFMTRGGGGA